MKLSRLLIGLSAYWVLILGLGACDDQGTVQNWIENTARLKTEAIMQIPNVPYRDTQHHAFKEYFSELNELRLALPQNDKFREGLNKALSQTNLNELCLKIFMKRETWEKLVTNCTKNRFFLCTEDVKTYPDFFNEFRNSLNTELQKKFDSTTACQDAP
jgi:hypothetical protein